MTKLKVGQCVKWCFCVEQWLNDGSIVGVIVNVTSISFIVKWITTEYNLTYIPEDLKNIELISEEDYAMGVLAYGGG